MTDFSQRWVVVVDALNYRDAPSLTGAKLGRSPYGDKLLVDPSSRTEAEGYVWYNHSGGWSAFVHTSSGGNLAKLDTTPSREFFETEADLIQTLPMGMDSKWFQYYGNTPFAKYNGHHYNYPNYSQGLHGGLDFFAEPDGAVKAVADGTVAERLYRGSRSKEQLWVKSGHYVFIYQHISIDPSIGYREKIEAGDTIGTLHHWGGNSHLHLEIRYRDIHIVNPLWMMSGVLASRIYSAYDPNQPADPAIRGSDLEYFYTRHGSDRWVKPLDQPVIRLGGMPYQV